MTKRGLFGIKHYLEQRQSRRRLKDINVPVELSAEEKDFVFYLLEKQLTMVSAERLFATLLACKHVIERDIPGDFVECGVWRGGNAMMAAKIFSLYNTGRRVYLFDTFAGMTAPTERDRKASNGLSLMATFLTHQKEQHNSMAFCPIETVQQHFRDADLLNDNIVFVKGDVAETLSDDSHLPKAISVLRLDTDWYESTRIELEVLYPRLSAGGSLIIDDYGHYTGSREATDEYFARYDKRPMFHYIDYTCRAGIKEE